MSLAKLSLALPIGLLIAITLVPPVWHLPAGLLAWALLRWAARDVHRTFGSPGRWLQVLVVLCVLGAFFGTADASLLSLSWSKSGALSGATMIVRAFGLIALTSLASSVLLIRRWTDRLRNPAVRRFLGVVIIAANLVPVQLRALSVAANTLKERRPGLRRLPDRLWLLATHSALRAALLAENVALDLAVAAHNASERQNV